MHSLKITRCGSNFSISIHFLQENAPSLSTSTSWTCNMITNKYKKLLLDLTLCNQSNAQLYGRCTCTLYATSLKSQTYLPFCPLIKWTFFYSKRKNKINVVYEKSISSIWKIKLIKKIEIWCYNVTVAVKSTTLPCLSDFWLAE